MSRAAGAPVVAGERLLTTVDLAIGRAGRDGRVVQSGLEVGVDAGTSTVVTGENGAGKTTLALTLAGLLPPRSGAVRAESALADGAGPHPIRWRSRQLLTRIGTVFQEPGHQFVAPTVRRELEVGPQARKRPAAEIATTTDELLEALRLDHLAAANPFTLSGGEQRRLSVATTLATAPRVIVLDEPTFGQDRRTWTELVGIMARLVADGRALVSVTHDPEVVRVMGDRVVRLEKAA